MSNDPSRSPIIIHVDHIGGLGNRMFEYMAALFLSTRIEGARLSGIDLPEWGISEPDIRCGAEREFVVHRDTHMRMPLESIFTAIAENETDCVVIKNYVQHMDNYLPADLYRDIFVDDDPRTGLVGPDELLINLRGNEILTGVAPDYLLLPVSYYRGIVHETGLRPVFMGQLTPSPYLDAITEAFPDARMIPSQGMMQDFSIVRHATNIVVRISTFSWLAAWLSQAERIFLPVAGVFSPFQRDDIGLLPFDDPRYRFDLFPCYFSRPAEQAIAQHRALDGLWRRMTGKQIRDLFHARPRFPVDITVMQRFFDEDYYCSRHWDIGAAKAGGHLRSGFEHYARNGLRERREPFSLDRNWYCSEYPMAAFEIGQGDYLNSHHHYAEVGALRGYLPNPP